MGTYSVSDARSRLPKLIDEALAGEDVVITHRGKPVVELRPVARADVRPDPAYYESLRVRRNRRKPSPISSVELLRQLYEEE